jgi:hypothetical protein
MVQDTRAVCAMPIGHTRVLAAASMYQTHIGVTRFTESNSLACAYGDYIYTGVVLFFKSGQDGIKQP